MSETGTSAPQATYPTITPAPRSSDGARIVDNRVAESVKTYPKIVPAEQVVDKRCPTCGR